MESMYGAKITTTAGRAPLHIVLGANLIASVVVGMRLPVYVITTTGGLNVL